MQLEKKLNTDSVAPSSSVIGVRDLSYDEESTYNRLHTEYTRFCGWTERGRDALEQDITTLVKEGKSRSQAIREIAEKKGVELSPVVKLPKRRLPPSLEMKLDQTKKDKRRQL